MASFAKGYSPLGTHPLYLMFRACPRLKLPFEGLRIFSAVEGAALHFGNSGSTRYAFPSESTGDLEIVASIADLSHSP